MLLPHCDSFPHSEAKGQYMFFTLLCRQYWVDKGLVTGGQYGSKQGCQPYQLPHCAHHEPGPYPNCSSEKPTPHCSSSCQPGYPKTYEQDKHYGEKAYGVRGVSKIMTEIMTNGPVEGAFTVYSDFPTYKSGELVSMASPQLPPHAVNEMLCDGCHRRCVPAQDVHQTSGRPCHQDTRMGNWKWSAILVRV